MRAFSIASYNVLADAYLRPEWFEHVDPRHLDPAWREPALVRRIEALDADVVCLQEVEEPRHERLAAALAGRGYEGRFARKGRGRPDGCSTFVRAEVAAISDVRPLRYADGGAGGDASGHVALITRLDVGDVAVTVANTHVRFDAAARRGADHVGVRQVRELVAVMDETPDARVICGDLNHAADSEVVRTLIEAGYADAYAARPRDFTCNANARARRIDFLLVGGGLRATPRPLDALADDAPLPSAAEPSDHLPIRAALTAS